MLNNNENIKVNSMDASSQNSESQSFEKTRFLWFCFYVVIILISVLFFIKYESVGKYTIQYHEPLEPEKIDDMIEIRHFGCSIDVLINYWRKGYTAIRFYQFCDLYVKVIYGKCHRNCIANGKQICKCCYHQEIFFNKPSIDNNISEGFVLDSFEELFYTEIKKEEFKNGKKILKFYDQPCGSWPEYYNKHQLRKIYRTQHFKLFLVGNTKSNQLDTFKSWKWSYRMLYMNGETAYLKGYLEETNDELPVHLICLPNANNCVSFTKPTRFY